MHITHFVCIPHKHYKNVVCMYICRCVYIYIYVYTHLCSPPCPPHPRTNFECENRWKIPKSLNPSWPASINPRLAGGSHRKVWIQGTVYVRVGFCFGSFENQTIKRRHLQSRAPLPPLSPLPVPVSLHTKTGSNSPLPPGSPFPPPDLLWTCGFLEFWMLETGIFPRRNRGEVEGGYRAPSQKTCPHTSNTIA